MVIWVEMPSPCILKGVIVSNNGIPIVNAFTIATGVNYDKSAHVIFNGVNYFVTYSRQNGTIYELWGQHYNTTGSPVGNVVRITSTPYSAIYGDIAVGTNSRYLNVWGEYRMNNYDIYANIDIEMVAIREEIDRGKTTNPLKATFVKDLIELVNTDEEAEVLDVTGRYLGRTNKGLYDCSRLNTGTYFILMKPRRNFKVIKIK
ncbi:MAG: hypothetical protein ABIL46_08055 [candidate division WOR-3 bacterium]